MQWRGSDSVGIGVMRCSIVNWRDIHLHGTMQKFLLLHHHILVRLRMAGAIRQLTQYVFMKSCLITETTLP